MLTDREKRFIEILDSEVVPALGCTEPVAVALAAAHCAKLLERNVDEVEISLSGNILKNGMGVGIPGTGMVGLYIAAALGVKGGNPDLDLRVLENIDADVIDDAKRMVEKNVIRITKKETGEKLYIEVLCKGPSGKAKAVIKGSHTNLIFLSVNDRIIKATECHLIKDDEDVDDSVPKVSHNMSVAEIFDFVNTVPLDAIEYILDGAEMNKVIAREGICGNYGLKVGRTILNNVRKGVLCDDISTYAMALTAAASDARMAGSTLPVMSNSGSGNQGITVFLPIAAAAERLKCEREQLIRALYFGNLIAIHLKEFMEKLSALCGVVTAATGASCGIVYLMGGEIAHVNAAIKNMIGNISGMFCDGAKAGCALKVSTAISAAVQSAILAIDNIEISEFDGIIEKDIEKTIRNLALIASKGMEETDRIILDIMTCK